MDVTTILIQLATSGSIGLILFVLLFLAMKNLLRIDLNLHIGDEDDEQGSNGKKGSSANDESAPTEEDDLR